MKKYICIPVLSQEYSDVNHLESIIDLEQNCIISEPQKNLKINLHAPFSTPYIKKNESKLKSEILKRSFLLHQKCSVPLNFLSAK